MLGIDRELALRGGPSQGTRLRRSGRRWLDVLVRGVAGGATVGLADEILFHGALPRVVPGYLPAAAVLGGAVLCLVGPRRIREFLGLRHVWSYPAPWVGVLAGLSTLLALVSPRLGLAAVAASALIVAGVGLTAAVGTLVSRWILVARMLLRARADHDPAPEAKTEEADADDGDPEPETEAEGDAELEVGTGFDGEPDREAQAAAAELDRWVRSDEPESDEARDRFGFAPLVSRLQQRFWSDDQAVTLLVGDPGSGKSTVLHMLQKRIADWDRLGLGMRVVPVSLWPYASVDSAIHAVLEAVVRALSQHLSTLEFRDVPAAYVRAAHDAGAPTWLLLPALIDRKTPQELLASLARAAEAVNLRLVLWLEDVERLTPDASTDRRRGSSLSLGALLAELSSTTSFRIVVSLTRAAAGADPGRLAGYVEWMPEPTPVEVLSLLERFRRMQLLEHPHDFEIGDGFRAEDDPWEAWWRLSSRRDAERVVDEPDAPSAVGAAAGLVFRNPRRIKVALRKVRTLWTTLHGEINLTDLMLMCLLESGYPEVADVVRLRIRDLRAGREPGRSSEPSAPTPVEADLEAAMAGLGAQDRQCLRRVLSSIFPGLAEPGASPRPQGLGSTTHDVWARYVRGRVDSGEWSDQALARLFRQWIGENASAAEATLTGKAGLAINVALTTLDPDRLASVLGVTSTHAEQTALLQAVCRRNLEQRGIPSGAPALNAVARLLAKRGESDAGPREPALEWVRGSMDGLAGKRCICAVELAWAFGVHPDDPAAGRVADLRVNRALAEALASHLAAPERFQEALADAPGHCLKLALWCVSALDPEGASDETEADRILAALVAAARARGGVYLAQLAGVLSTDGLEPARVPADFVAGLVRRHGADALEALLETVVVDESVAWGFGRWVREARTTLRRLSEEAAPAGRA